MTTVEISIFLVSSYKVMSYQLKHFSCEKDFQIKLTHR